MRIAYDISFVRPTAEAYVTVGVFDGVHCGHQRLIGAMTQSAHAAGRLAIAYTFDPHPLTVLGREAPPLLTTVEERAELIAALGLDILVVPRFTLDTVRTRASDFTHMLVRDLHMVELWAGPDFALGYQREGTISRLEHLGTQQGFTVRLVAPLMCGGSWISSSRVRAALAGGDVAWAAQCLGRPYRLPGVTSAPGPLGQATEIATASITPVPRRMVPGTGVYACSASVGGRNSLATAAYVIHTDADGPSDPIIEVRLLDHREAAHEQTISLDFVDRVRDTGEENPSSPALASQLEDDVERVRQLLDSAAAARAQDNGCLLQPLDLE